jgi:hypothetical protein
LSEFGYAELTSGGISINLVDAIRVLKVERETFNLVWELNIKFFDLLFSKFVDPIFKLSSR